MRNHDAEEERALYPREMDIRGSITTFYCISISFPGGQRKRGKLEIEREREREREVEIASGSIIRGERKRRGRRLSLSLLARKNGV